MVGAEQEPEIRLTKWGLESGLGYIRLQMSRLRLLG